MRWPCTRLSKTLHEAPAGQAGDAAPYSALRESAWPCRYPFRDRSSSNPDRQSRREFSAPARSPQLSCPTQSDRPGTSSSEGRKREIALETCNTNGGLDSPEDNRPLDWKERKDDPRCDWDGKCVAGTNPSVGFSDSPLPTPSTRRHIVEPSRPRVRSLWFVPEFRNRSCPRFVTISKRCGGVRFAGWRFVDWVPGWLRC